MDQFDSHTHTHARARTHTHTLNTMLHLTQHGRYQNESALRWATTKSPLLAVSLNGHSTEVTAWSLLGSQTRSPIVF